MFCEGKHETQFSATSNYFEGSLSTGISDIIQGFFPNKKLLSRTRFNKLAPWRSIWSHLAHQNRARVWVMLSEGKHETQFSANGNMKKRSRVQLYATWLHMGRFMFAYTSIVHHTQSSSVELHILVLFITHRVHLWNFLACVWTPLSWVTVMHKLLLVWNNCCVQTVCCGCLHDPCC